VLLTVLVYDVLLGSVVVAVDGRNTIFREFSKRREADMFRPAGITKDDLVAITLPDVLGPVLVAVRQSYGRHPTFFGRSAVEREIRVGRVEPYLTILKGANGWRENAVDTLGPLRFVVSWSNDKQRDIPFLLGFPEVCEYLRGILGCRRFDFDSESVGNVGMARPRVRFLAAILCEDRDREAECGELFFDLAECCVVVTPQLPARYQYRASRSFLRLQ